MKLGVLQGRLSEPVDGLYQEFPRNWRREFSFLRELGLSGVEWLITPASFRKNPLFLNPLSIKDRPILSICVDTLVNDLIDDEDFLKTHLDPVCKQAPRVGVNILTIPILDESDLSDDEKRNSFCNIIKRYGEKYPQIKFAFEAELSINKLNDIVKLCDNFYVTYDTGNITSCGVNHEDFIEFFGDKIINVHIKDRTFDRQTVSPTTGDTDFDLIFKKLSSKGYSGHFILQTARAITGDEVATIKNHTKIFKDLYDKYF